MLCVSLWQCFTDPVLQAPTLASLLMCLSASLVGVLLVLRKRSLLAEALSHAAYPGVVLSGLCLAFFFPEQISWLSFLTLPSAVLTSILGLGLVGVLERRFGVKSDSALCFVLSFFFGIGILGASRLQSVSPLAYKSVQIFLFGQAATMTDIHILVYGILTVFVVGILFTFFKQVQIALFDRDFSQTVGVSLRFLDSLLFFLLVLAIVIGIRSVGVVLMAGMLIAPAVAARQFTHRLRTVFFLAGGIGVCSGVLGNYLSLQLPVWGGWKISLPTGPMILLCAATVTFFSLLFSPKRGLVVRCVRAVKFRRRCQEENLLKFFWKQDQPVSWEKVCRWSCFSKWQTRRFLNRLQAQGWMQREEKGGYLLTKEGRLRASRIVRLHRLWEAYLVSLGQGVEKVHRSAEEMEHILTPDLEKQLTELLGDPKEDPHAQPIPSRSGGL